MHASGREEQVVLVVGRDEALRMANVMAESLSLLSRPEFYIRTGCAKPNIEELVRQLRDIAEGAAGEFAIDIPAGVEMEENPPRPRR